MQLILTVIKKYLYPFVISICCITAFFISKWYCNNHPIQKEIIYKNTTANEATIIWGTGNWDTPSKEYWPANSYLKNDELHTPMIRGNDHYKLDITLPQGYQLIYTVSLNNSGFEKPLEMWEKNERESIKVLFEYTFFSPGYFILLAGVLPLFLLYFQDRKRSRHQVSSESVSDLAPSKYGNKYISQLDAIRAIAVLLVLVHHWIPFESKIDFLHIGPLGVNIFFVISGFLITRILLEGKKAAELKEGNKFINLKNFVIRRSLRIFPIYYLALLTLYLVNYQEHLGVREHIGSYMTYTANYLFFGKQQFSKTLAHVWSLCVEEPFYIFWPWLMLFVNKRFLPYLIGIFIVIGISTNYILNEPSWWTPILTPACFDAFGIGALLSYILVYRQDRIPQFLSIINIAVKIAVLLFLLLIFNNTLFPIRTIHAILALWLISYCLFYNNNKALNKMLNNKYLIFLGKISYGIYLYHLFLPYLWSSVLNKFASWNIDLLYNQRVQGIATKHVYLFVQHSILLLIVCQLSWKLVEKPFNNLKKYFN